MAGTKAAGQGFSELAAVSLMASGSPAGREPLSTRSVGRSWTPSLPRTMISPFGSRVAAGSCSSFVGKTGQRAREKLDVGCGRLRMRLAQRAQMASSTATTNVAHGGAVEKATPLPWLVCGAPFGPRLSVSTSAIGARVC